MSLEARIRKSLASKPKFKTTRRKRCKAGFEVVWRKIRRSGEKWETLHASPTKAEALTFALAFIRSLGEDHFIIRTKGGGK
jgi:hypothetical protein